MSSLALPWRHIDWTAQVIRVETGYVRGEFNDPKSEGSSRSVPMPTIVAQELARLHQRSAWKGDDDLVFAHPHTGNPLDARESSSASTRPRSVPE